MAAGALRFRDAHRLEKEQGLFGTPAITEAWARAVTRHPLAYLRHRAAFMWNFLAGNNLTMWLSTTSRVRPRPCFRIARLSSRWSRCTTCSSRRRCSGLARGCWFASSYAGSPGGDAETPEGAFALGVCGSAAVYVLTFVAVGVASGLSLRLLGCSSPASLVASSAALGMIRKALPQLNDRWVPVFRKDHAQTKIERDDDRRKVIRSRPARARHPGESVPGMNPEQRSQSTCCLQEAQVLRKGVPAAGADNDAVHASCNRLPRRAAAFSGTRRFDQISSSLTPASAKLGMRCHVDARS